MVIHVVTAWTTGPIHYKRFVQRYNEILQVEGVNKSARLEINLAIPLE